jgi:Gas vesicle synthesis protein GvpL/GvpF
MSASTQERPGAEPAQQTGTYVYGMVPGDVELNVGVLGVGDPPGEIRLVRSGDLAALVSEVDITQPLGTPEDLQAHEEILDSVVTEAPVLPLRFGAVLTSEDAVAEELLEANHDEFAAALRQLEGRAEYVVRGRYAEQAVLEEILSENPAAAQLRDQIRGTNPNATRGPRIQLGELINKAIAAKREADTRLLLAAMKDRCVASVVRAATNELDAVYVAFLVEADKLGELEEVLTELGDRWQGRVQLSIIGPMAPYDFVGNLAGAGG